MIKKERMYVCMYVCMYVKARIAFIRRKTAEMAFKITQGH